ncbi:hypothetical protein MMC25_001926 [Agyrium rufum]|nr:hypothetical protein [Agyrium rufum]
MDDAEIPPLVDTGKETDVTAVLSQQRQAEVRLEDVRVPITIITAADIEKAMTVNQDGQEVQEWLDLANGCICCSVKDQGVNAIESLMKRRGAFDYILLETTGLADPGNIAPIFWVDDGLGSTIYLDGIVTLIDGKNILRSLKEMTTHEESDAKDDATWETSHGDHLTTAHLQISHADVILLNKSDLLSSDEVDAVMARIRSINSLAKVQITQHSKVSELSGTILDIHAYDRVSLRDIEAKGHSHHDSNVSTITIEVPVLTKVHLGHLENWLRKVLWESELPLPPGAESTTVPFAIHRSKGLIILDSGQLMMIQGVRETFEITNLERVEDRGEDAQVVGKGKLVFIGEGLADHRWQASLSHYLSNS